MDNSDYMAENDSQFALGVSDNPPAADEGTSSNAEADHADLNSPSHTACGTRIGFLRGNCKSLGLRDLSFLSRFDQLQYLDISDNNIQDVSPLEDLKFIVHLTASKNFIVDINPIGKLKFLRTLDLRSNRISDYSALSSLTQLREVDLSHNLIQSVSDLQLNTVLRVLRLSYNQIERLGGPPAGPSVSHLDLSYNLLTGVGHLVNMTAVQTLDLRGNRLISLAGLQAMFSLQSLDVSYNLIRDGAEILLLKDHRCLTDLYIESNPLDQPHPDKRLVCAFHMPQLLRLDAEPITALDKTLARALLAPSIEATARREHADAMLRLFENTQTFSARDPEKMIVLCGPCGTSKRRMCQLLLQRFPRRLVHGISITTRAVREEGPSLERAEVDGVDYFFVTKAEFQQKRTQGVFMQTSSINGFLYGFPWSALDMPSEPGSHIITHMELEGLLQLKLWRRLRLFCILVMPESDKKYWEVLNESGEYSESQVGSLLVPRLQLYRNYLENHPGYFDHCIFDESRSSFDKVSRLVEERLDSDFVPTPLRGAEMRSGDVDALRRLITP